ncbi:MAG: inorganic diphosphatase [Candidatus Baltobacteraceae bacterium]
MSKDVNATHYENIPPFPEGPKEAGTVHVIIETVQGSPHKNALDAKYGIIKLRAVLAEGLRWPYDYGFVPQTLADDGDPLDLLFLVDKPTFPGALAEARVLGSIRLKKNGVENDRLIGAPVKMEGTPQTADPYTDVSDIPKEKMDAICKFLIDYSQEAGNEIDYCGTISAHEAMRSVEKCMKRWHKKQKK